MMKKLYQILFLCCSLFFVGNQTVKAQNLQADSIALIDLYNLCGGANWSGYDTWLNGPISTWEGVTVDEAMQRVTHVAFKNMNLTGTLPASLGNMNEMSGKIEMHDDIGMTGELPAVIWKWTKVERFQLKRTGITSIDMTGIENMVNLTEYNTEKNAITGPAPGVVFTLPAMEKVYLHDCKYDAVPTELNNAAGKLSRLYFNGNDLTDLPDLTNMTWKSGAKIRLQNNALTFEDLEPIVRFAADENVAELKYSPQAVVGAETYTYPAAGSAVNLDGTIGGSANVYTWINAAEEVVGDAATLNIPAFDAATNSGAYYAVVQSELVPGLDIIVAPQKLFASATAQDSLALVAFMMHNNGGYSNWLTDPISAWEGVTMDEAGQRVTHVAFKGMNVTGSLVEALGDLTEMGGKIEFHDDAGLVGELPAAIWKWTNVERFQLKRSGITSINTTGMENMVNLTEYNTEKNPIGGTIPGVIFTLPAMEKIYLHDCEYDAIPAEMTTKTGLTRLYLNGNKLTALPDMAGMTWGDGAKVRVQNNYLTFEDLEGNVAMTSNPLVAEFKYSPQAAAGTEAYQYPDAGSAVNLDGTIGGSANVYTWINAAEEVVGDAATLNIPAFDAAINSGSYYAVVQSALVPGLDIIVAPQKLFASVQAQDSLALVDLYNTNGGSSWEGYPTWLNGPISTWEGVTVDSASQRITHVAFKGMNLTGTLAQSMEDITEMGGKIELHDDPGMTGELPAFIWKWTNVERFQLKRTGITSIDLTGIENMVNLTEYNTEKNPIGGTIPGVIFTLPAMKKVYLHDCEYDAIPAEMTSAVGLDRLYLNGNNITDLPDMSGMVWGDGAKVRVHNNHLTFEDLEGNVAIAADPLVEEFRYSPQANIGVATNVEVVAGDTVTMEIAVGGSANVYTWIRGVEEVVSDMPVYTIIDVTAAHAGDYRLLVQNALVPGLDLISETYQLFVDGVTSVNDVNYFGEINLLGNPVQNTLRVDADRSIERILIHSISGQQVTNQVVNNQQISVPVSSLTPGLYLVTLQSEGQFYTLKMVKE